MRTVFLTRRSKTCLTALCLLFPFSIQPAAAGQNPPAAPAKPGQTPAAKPVPMPPEVQKAAQQFDRAIQFHKAGKISQAIAAYKEFLRLAQAAKLPARTSYPAYGNLALLYAAQNNRRAEADTLRQMLKVEPKNATVWAKLSNADMSLGRATEARTEAEKALLLSSDAKVVGPARYTLGYLAIQRKDYVQAEQEYALALKAAPDNVQALLNHANVLQRLKKFVPAMAEAKKARSLAPTALEPRTYIAALYQEMKDYPAAITAYRDALRVSPGNPALLFNLAEMQRMTKKTQDAISTYLDFVSVAPQNYAGHLNLAELYYTTGNFAAAKPHFAAAVKYGRKGTVPPLIGLAMSEVQDAANLRDAAQRSAGYRTAEDHFKQVLALEPDNEAAQRGLMYLYQQDNRTEDAIVLLRKQMARKPDDLTIIRQIAAQYQLQQKPDEAIKIWREYRDRKPDDSASYREVATLLQTTGKPDEAQAELQIYLKKHPGDGETQLASAQIYANAKKYAEAQKAYSAMLAADTTGKAVTDPKAKEAAQTKAEANRLQALQGLALMTQQQNKWEDAIQYWNQVKVAEAAKAAKAKTPPNPLTYRAIAYAYEQLKKYDQAVREYQELTNIAPDDFRAYVDLARVYDTQDKTDEAVAAYRKAAEHSPDPVDALLQIPALYSRHKKDDLALTEYEALDKKYPKDKRVLAPLAQLYVQTGKDEQAVAAYDALMKADPNAHYAEDLKAAALIRLKRYADALPVYEQAVNRNPDVAQNYLEIARLYDLQGKPDGYLPWLQGRLEKTPANRNVMNYFIEAYTLRKRENEGFLLLKSIVAKNSKNREVLETYASLLTQHQHNDEALEAYRQIASQNPKDINILMTVTDMSARAGKVDEAVRYLESIATVTDFKPEEKRVINRKLANLYKQNGKPEKAIPLFEEDVKAHPGDYMSSTNLAQLYSDTGRDAEAIPLYETLLKNPSQPIPTQSSLRDKIGAIYEKQGKKADAIAQYKLALQVNPKDTLAAEALKRLGDK